MGSVNFFGATMLVDLVRALLGLEQPSSSQPTDRDLMLRAIDLSKKCTSEPDNVSPRVGALVVRNGEVLGEAYRGEMAPGEHAEFTLLERKLPAATLAGTTLFTTLEPCTVRNDPKIPCAERIAERQIQRVVIGVLDPNEHICGRGERYLLARGIEVTRFNPDLMAEIEELNREFTRDQRKQEADGRQPATTDQPKQKHMPYVGTLVPNSGTLKVNQPVTLEFTGSCSGGYENVRWVRLVLGPSHNCNDNWPNQIYLSITPAGRLDLWDSEGKFTRAQLPAKGDLETDTAAIHLDDTVLSCEGDTLSLRLRLVPRLQGKLKAYLTTVSDPDWIQTGMSQVGQFLVR